MRAAVRIIAALAALAWPAAARAAVCLHDSPRVEAACIGLEQANGPRAYRLFVPAGLPPGPRPLLVLLHGAGGSGAAMEGLTLHAFNRLAEREGLVVAYPDGLLGTWAAGLVGTRTYDLDFLGAVLDDVQRRAPVDPSRIQVAGFSMGAMMALRLACQMGDRLAAVAAIGGYLPQNMAQDCSVRPGLRLLLIGGDRDPIVPFAGGAPSLGGRSYGQMLGAGATAAFFAQRLGCTAPAMSRAVDDKPDDGTRLVIGDWACVAPAAVELVTVEGGGHTWPGALMYAGERLIGPLSQEMDPAAPVWAFLAGVAR